MSTLFPYTTLFRSHDQVVPQAIDTGQRDAVEGHAAQEKSDRQQRLGDGGPEPVSQQHSARVSSMISCQHRTMRIAARTAPVNAQSCAKFHLPLTASHTVE